MLDPVELKLFPSCFDCISWSPDGALAVALGECVHVLIPQIKATTSFGTTPTPSTSNTQWTTTKFRTNIFTNKEWPMIFPQPGETFSLGEEQSTSHVVALAWSPQRLAKYSRHVLAVLTSNLVLSLWELADGQSKWVRTVVVNSALREAFGPSLEGKSSILQRKQHVRSFCWSPKCDNDHNKDVTYEHPACQDVSLLAVANDMNDMTLIRVRNDRRGSDTNTRRRLWAEVISRYEIPPPTMVYPHVQPDSLLGQSMRSVHIISHITWGRWRQSLDDEGNLRHTSPLAIIHATEVKVFLLHARFEESGGEGEGEGDNTDVKLSLRLSEAIPISQEEQFQHMSFHGPPHWIDYEVNESSMTYTTDTQSHTPILHVAHLSSSLHSLPLSATQTRHITVGSNGHSDNAQSADLYRQIEGFRSRFDLDHDLGGMSIARVWGMASHRDWIAACFTVHPSDMVEYITTARERSRIVFTPPHPENSQGPGELPSVELPWDVPSQLTPKRIKAARTKVLSFIFRESQRDLSNDPWARKLQYAAICCVITDQDPVDEPHLLEAAKLAAQWLSSTFSLDLSVELSCIDKKLQWQIQHSAETAAGLETSKLIPHKTREAQRGSGYDVFEFCDICGSGIDWYSVEESQCAEGHVFARCGLTFLSIQDPSISKRCSVCGGEVLDAELVEIPSLVEPDMEAAIEPQPQRQHGGLLDILCETFDTCIYCGGKFRE
ncbi:hypothetical protein EMCG_03631 [[Emmonsia] crescens]|uniref:Transcription factor IIIC 90kDa subunit N-terminal domain-containing protein n=1 Tax=[Emmonsia] crescens TaxID=73230 RepID=A0A0G2HUH2_9EURO|nr:hypothetical protein EMCG_03631 [Emmonsia crescens UAMH 3008]